jgi:hypothetical protein
MPIEMTNARSEDIIEIFFDGEINESFSVSNGGRQK